jgi:hypothetical protein
MYFIPVMHSGIVPVSELPCKDIALILSHVPIEDGRLPVSLLFPKSNCCTYVKALIEDGR